MKWSPCLIVGRTCNVTTSTYGVYSLNPFPKWHEDICQVTVPWGKGNTLIFQEPLDIRFELTLIPENSKCHCTTLIGAEINRGQIINGVWTWGHLQWVHWAYHAILQLFLASGKVLVLIPWPVVERLCGRQRQSRGAPDTPTCTSGKPEYQGPCSSWEYCRSYHHH